MLAAALLHQQGEEWFDRFAGFLDWLTLSIDSASPAIHQRLGRSVSGRALSVESYMEASRRTRARGMRVKVNTVPPQVVPRLEQPTVDEKGELVLLIVLEMQRDEDPDKKYSWPVYVTVVRAKRRCQAIVLVVAPDEKVAAWAAETIDVGLGRTTTQPLVLGPAVVPQVTDPAEAEREAELAILSAVAHGNGPNGLAVVAAALAALGRVDQEHAAVYFQVVYNALREPMRRALEAHEDLARPPSGAQARAGPRDCRAPPGRGAGREEDAHEQDRD